eukprot:s497_g24.t1
MGVKEGATAFLRLEGFELAWREAVLLSNPGGGRKLVLAVRISYSEAHSEEAQCCSLFECRSEKFMLVEGKEGQIRDSCNREVRGLEVASNLIFAAGKEKMEQSSDLQYATASEDPVPEAPAARARGVRVKLDSSSDESDGDEDAASEDEIFKLFRKARQHGAKQDSNSEKEQRGRSNKKKERYQLFAEKDPARNRKSSSTSGLEALLRHSISAGSSSLSAENLNALASWLLLRYADPVEPPKFSGEPQDLERVAGYLQALEKLEKRLKGLGRADPDDETGKGKKGKGNKKNQKSAEEKED